MFCFFFYLATDMTVLCNRLKKINECFWMPLRSELKLEKNLPGAPGDVASSILGRLYKEGPFERHELLSPKLHTHSPRINNFSCAVMSKEQVHIKCAYFPHLSLWFIHVFVNSASL